MPSGPWRHSAPGDAGARCSDARRSRLDCRHGQTGCPLEHVGGLAYQGGALRHLGYGIGASRHLRRRNAEQHRSGPNVLAERAARHRLHIMCRP